MIWFGNILYEVLLVLAARVDRRGQLGPLLAATNHHVGAAEHCAEDADGHLRVHAVLAWHDLVCAMFQSFMLRIRNEDDGVSCLKRTMWEPIFWPIIS